MGKKTSLPHIAMQVFNNPLMIQPAKLDVILNILGDRIGLEGDQFYITMTEEETREMAKNSSVKRPPAKSQQIEVAVVPVIGTLVHRSTGFDGWSGLRSYQRLEEDIMAAANNPNINAILLDVDSPGGAVSGVFELERKIREAKEKKPIYAYVNENSYSAAYLLSSAADKIFMPGTGGAGSIGVRMVHVDVSEKDKKDGVKVTNLYVGERKVDFDPHAPLTEEARKDEMAKLNKLYDMFVERVAENRNLSVKEIKDTEAGTFLGEQAVKMGLADEIMSFDEAIEFIVNDVAARKEEGKIPSAQTIEEDVNMFKNLQELKDSSPELYSQVMEEAKSLVLPDVKKSFETEKQGLEATITSMKTELSESKESIKKLEKANFIREQNETRLKIETSADKIWTKALANCEVPENMHGKVKSMLDETKYVKDGSLDEEAFTAAVASEIEDWEGKGMKTSVLGSGFGRPSGETENVEISAKSEKEDNEWLESMLAGAGDDVAAEKLRKEVQ